MKKCVPIMLLAIMLVYIICLAGCFHGQGEELDEKGIKYMRQVYLEGQMLLDDVDTVLLTDQPTKLSERSVR